MFTIIPRDLINIKWGSLYSKPQHKMMKAPANLIF